MEDIQSGPAIIRTSRRRRERIFYVGMSVAVVLTGFAGFAPTYYLRPLFTNTPLFSILVSSGLYFRRKPDAHKRLMMLATISILAAAIARLPFAFLQAGPPAFFGLTDVFVLICVLYDLITLRRIHRATALAGLLIVASQPLRLIVGGTQAWLSFATWLTHLVS